MTAGVGHSNQEMFVKKEAAWGTGVNPTAPTSGLAEVLGRTKDFSYKIANSNEVYNTASTSIPTHKSIGNTQVTGTYNFEYINAMPFVPILGTVAAENPVEGQAPYTWTITPTDAVPSFSASLYSKATNSITTQLVGCYATSLDFKLGVTGIAEGSMNFIGKTYTRGTSFTAPTTITLDDAEPVEPATSTITVGALTDIAYLTGIDFNITRNAAIEFALSSRTGVLNKLGKYGAITGQLTSWVEDTATAQELETLVTGSDTTIGTTPMQDITVKTGGGTGADSMVITIKDAVLDSAEMKFPLDTGIGYTIPFKAKYISSVVWEAPVTVAAGGW